MARTFVVDPNAYDKQSEFTRAVDYIKEFLDTNGLDHPSNIKHEGYNTRFYGCYYFKTRRVNINLKKTRTPVKNPGWSWSYTGFKSDLTGPGVLAHEIGHHIHNLIQNSKNRKLIKNSCVFVARREAEVSSYEPNYYEMLAESIRLFILNPVFLAEGRPLRYKFLTESFGLKPLHQEDWRSILRNAHPKLIEAGDKWIAKGQR